MPLSAKNFLAAASVLQTSVTNFSNAAALTLPDQALVHSLGGLHYSIGSINAAGNDVATRSEIMGGSRRAALSQY